MYKTDFYITLAGKRDPLNRVLTYEYKKVSGWGETMEAPDGSIVEIRLDKRPERWRITEDTTGFAVSFKTFSTRADALAALTPKLLQSIAKALTTPEAREAADRLADYILTH